jgi:hypothetical protein
MKRIVITAALLFGAVAAAQADTATQTYRDQVRPNGLPRSEAIFQAALDSCTQQTGGKRTFHDTPAFRSCMLGRGYRWASLGVERDPAPRQHAVREHTWIDPETGLTCHDILGGLGSSCSNL